MVTPLKEQRSSNRDVRNATQQKRFALYTFYIIIICNVQLDH